MSSLPLPSAHWEMPILPEHYDRSPLNAEEYRALEYFATGERKPSMGNATIQARQTLARLNQPIADICALTNPKGAVMIVGEVHQILRREMYHRSATFWNWSAQEWVEILCPTPALFNLKVGKAAHARSTIMDMAYLLGGVTDLREADGGRDASKRANVYFGKDHVDQQCQRILDVLVGNQQLGYKSGEIAQTRIRRCVSLLFILQRVPYLEAITEELLAEASAERDFLQYTQARIALALQRLNILPVPPPARKKLLPSSLIVVE